MNTGNRARDRPSLFLFTIGGCFEMLQLALFTTFQEVWVCDDGSTQMVTGYRYWNGIVEVLTSVLL